MKIEHYYKSIGEDWFTYPQLYRSMVQKFDNAQFVEVGCFLGRSASFLAVEINNSDKNIKLHCVDHWQGSTEHKGYDILKDDGLMLAFRKNIEPVTHIVNVVRKSSTDAAQDFEDRTLDFVFIDASHDYESVKADLAAWYPKVRNGGVFAGHDYIPSFPGVRQAVQEWRIKENITIREQENCWIADII